MTTGLVFLLKKFKISLEKTIQIGKKAVAKMFSGLREVGSEEKIYNIKSLCKKFLIPDADVRALALEEIKTRQAYIESLQAKSADSTKRRDPFDPIKGAVAQEQSAINIIRREFSEKSSRAPDFIPRGDLLDLDD
ncbi:MAG: hypothetical protein V1664_00705 [Candidatus Uhrbacteria bacterium]